jgi:hypothetical protein
LSYIGAMLRLRKKPRPTAPPSMSAALVNGWNNVERLLVQMTSQGMGSNKECSSACGLRDRICQLDRQRAQEVDWKKVDEALGRKPSRAIRRLEKISGAFRRGSLTFCNNFAVCHSRKDLKTLTISTRRHV